MSPGTFGAEGTNDRPSQRGRAGIDEVFEGVVLRDRWRPNYRARPVGSDLFLTSDHGTWAFLTQDEYQHLRGIALPRQLHDRLEAKGLIVTASNAEAVARCY